MVTAKDAKEKVEIFMINLYDGVIKGKSRLNLKDLFFKLDSNLKYVLTNIVLEHIGMCITPEGEVYAYEQDKTLNYVKWLKEKEEFENLKKEREENKNSTKKNIGKIEQVAKAQDL